jgi:hypothetical protein
MKRDKRTNNDLQNITQKIKNRVNDAVWDSKSEYRNIRPDH